MSAHLLATFLRCTRFFLLLAFGLFLSIPFSAHAAELPANVVERQTCGSTTVDIKAMGTGMMAGFDPVSIGQPRIETIDTSAGCAAISWDTSAPAATFVVVTEFGENPLAVDISKENYGYTFATSQNNDGEVTHTTIITGLKPGKVYAYRLVARAYPTALPVVSEARVIIAQDITVPPVASVNTTPTTPAAPVVEVPSAAVETPSTSVTATVEISSVGDVVPITPQGTVVPSATVAAESALDDATHERALWAKLIHTWEPCSQQFRSILIGVFLGLLAYLGYRFVLPLVHIRIKNWTMFGMLTSTLVAILGATFMLYYVTLVAIAAFLALLAWYLLTGIPLEDEGVKTPTQPKLIEGAEKTEPHSITKN